VNAGAPPAPPEAHVRDDGTGLRAALAIAVRGGLLAFVATAAVAQIPPLMIEIFGGGFALSTALKLGWFYELAFHRVGIVVSGTAGFQAHLSVAFLTGTAFVVWMLFRAGRAAGSAMSASSVRSHVLAGALVGPIYALPGSSGGSWRPAARSSPEPFGSRAWCGRRSSSRSCSVLSRAEPEAPSVRSPPMRGCACGSWAAGGCC
jgi:hypothetical protein